MLMFATRVGPSPIAGTGVFSMTGIAPGAMVGDLTHQYEFMSEDDYQEAQQAGDRWVIRCAIHLFDRVFVCRARTNDTVEPALENEDYLNHSENPNLLYHCGLLFARRPIIAGEELTVQYKYILAQNDATSFVDAVTGKPVTGLVGAERLRQSTRELLALLPFMSDESPATTAQDLPRNPPRESAPARSPRRTRASQVARVTR